MTNFTVYKTLQIIAFVDLLGSNNTYRLQNALITIFVLYLINT